jgi:outer membrane protein assembly factor BamB
MLMPRQRKRIGTPKRRTLHRAVFALCSVFLLAAPVAANWPQWRGPQLNGTSPEKNLPLRWGAGENVAWRLALPGLSASTPVVWGDRVFLNVPEGEEIYLWCVDKRRGALAWKRPLRGGAAALRTHPKHNPSTPSPATDGKGVFVLTAYGSLRGFDFAGRELWVRDLERDYGRFGLNFGYASSPLLHEDSLYVQVLRATRANDPSYILRIDKRTGQTVWKADFPAATLRAAESYSTPTILRHGRTAELVVNGSDQVTGHDLATGRELWRVAGLSAVAENPPPRVASSPVAADGVLYAPAAVRPLVALRAGGRGDIAASHQLWSSRNGPDIPSPVTDGKYFYVVNDKGIVRCFDAKTGREVWGPERLKPGNYSSSPVLADGKVYVVSEEGVTTVLRAGPKFEVLAENPLNDACLSSPAVSGGQILIRTAQFLYCIGKPQAARR